MQARTAVRRKSRERIGNDDARVWARELKLRNPFAKSILLALANYMNEDGSCYPGLSTISRDTDISEDVVGKRLRWLEEIGAIAVFRCWRDEHGRRNYEGRGKPTSSEIRFLFDADPEDIEARADDAAGDRPLRGAARRSHMDRGAEERLDEVAEENGPPVSDSEDSGFSTRHGRDEPDQHPASTLVAPDQHPPVAGTKPPPAAVRIDSSEEEQELQPQTPSQSEGAFGPSDSRNDEAEAWLREFGKRYPIPISNWVRALDAALAMTEQERADALTGADGYASLCRSQPKRAVTDAHRWLKNRQWAGYVSAGQEAQAIARRQTVPADSVQAVIWKAVYDIATRGQGFPYFMVKGSLVTISGELPAAMSAIATDRSQWFDVVEGDGSQRFPAWLRWLKTHLPNQRITFGPVGQARRLRVPCDWPPRKDGTIYKPGDDPPDQSAA